MTWIEELRKYRSCWTRADKDNLLAIAEAAATIAESGVSQDLPGVDYIEVQVDRKDWAALKAAVKGEAKC